MTSSIYRRTECIKRLSQVQNHGQNFHILTKVNEIKQDETKIRVIEPLPNRVQGHVIN